MTCLNEGLKWDRLTILFNRDLSNVLKSNCFTKKVSKQNVSWSTNETLLDIVCHYYSISLNLLILTHGLINTLEALKDCIIGDDNQFSPLKKK